MNRHFALGLLAAAALAAGCGTKPEPAPRRAAPGAQHRGRREQRLGRRHLLGRDPRPLREQARLPGLGPRSSRAWSRSAATSSAGQPLMRLDPAQEALHVVAAVADVDAAKSRVAQNRVDLQRTEQLLRAQVRLAGRGRPAAPRARAVGVAAEVGAGAAADQGQPARLHRAGRRPRRRRHRASTPRPARWSRAGQAVVTRGRRRRARGAW